MRTYSSSPNNQHPTPKPNMFPRMRTYSSSPNNQHPTPKPNMFPQMRTLHHHRTVNTQHPDQTCSLGCALYIITQQSTTNTQTKHVPSDAHFTSSPNNQHPTPKQNMFPRMRTLHHQPTINNQHPSKTCSLRCALYHHHRTINTQHPSQTCSLGCALIHHHLTINTQHPSQTCSPRCALYIITEQSTPNTQQP